MAYYILILVTCDSPLLQQWHMYHLKAPLLPAVHHCLEMKFYQPKPPSLSVLPHHLVSAHGALMPTFVRATVFPPYTSKRLLSEQLQEPWTLSAASFIVKGNYTWVTNKAEAFPFTGFHISSTWCVVTGVANLNKECLREPVHKGCLTVKLESVNKRESPRLLS